MSGRHADRIHAAAYNARDFERLVRGIFHAVGAGSGIGVDVESYVVDRFREDGLAHTVENWRNRASAERSSGLRFA
jgi:hypothetical protein